MSNRFEHLKDKEKASSTLDDFIEGANAPREARIAKEKKNLKEVLLSAPGRMAYEEGKATPFLLRLRKDVADEIDKHCHGSKQAIFNYLIQRGLEDLLKEGELVLL